MKVFALLRDKKSARLVKGALEKEGHLVRLFSDREDLFTTIYEDYQNSVELVIMDYYIFDHDYFNPFDEFISRSYNLPLIYYNDPYPQPHNLAEYWLMKNCDKYGECFDASFIMKLKELFNSLQDALLFDDAENYSSVEDFPKAEYKKVLRTALLLRESGDDEISEKFDFDIQDFCTRHKLSKSRKELLEYFHQNEGRVLELEQITRELWGTDTPAARQRVYSYVHDLRAAFKNDAAFSFQIIKPSKNKYSFFVTKEQRVPLINERSSYRAFCKGQSAVI